MVEALRQSKVIKLSLGAWREAKHRAIDRNITLMQWIEEAIWEKARKEKGGSKQK